MKMDLESYSAHIFLVGISISIEYNPTSFSVQGFWIVYHFQDFLHYVQLSGDYGCKIFWKKKVKQTFKTLGDTNSWDKVLTIIHFFMTYSITNIKESFLPRFLWNSKTFQTIYYLHSNAYSRFRASTILQCGTCI